MTASPIVVNKKNTWADVPDRRPAEEDLGAGLEGRQLARHRPVVPGRRARALRRRHGLGHLRLLHGGDRRRGGREPQRLHAERGRQRHGPRRLRRRRARSATSASPTTPRTADRLKALEVDGGDGCVEPSVETVQDGSYKPLSRPLFTYANEDALAEKPALDPFLTFVLDNEVQIAKGAKFVPMTAPADRRGADGARERRRRGRGMKPRSPDRHHTLHFPGTHGPSVRLDNRLRPRRTLKGDFSMRIRKLLLVGGATAAVALASVAAAVAGAQAIRGTVQADGSSTVAPFAQAAAESYERKYSGARVVVGVSGTGGGFERFCKNETDLSNASRPIRLSEAAKCHAAGIGYIQFLVANDGISLIGQPAEHVGELPDDGRAEEDLGPRLERRQLEPGSRRRSRTCPLRLFGPGTDSGTFEFFTEKINGTARRSRSDYSASEDDNVLVRGVAGERGGARLLRALVLPREQEPPEGSPGQLRRRLRHAERCERPEPLVQAALPRASSSTRRRRPSSATSSRASSGT